MDAKNGVKWEYPKIQVMSAVNLSLAVKYEFYLVGSMTVVNCGKSRSILQGVETLRSLLTTHCLSLLQQGKWQVLFSLQ